MSTCLKISYEMHKCFHNIAKYSIVTLSNMQSAKIGRDAVNNDSVIIRSIFNTYAKVSNGLRFSFGHFTHHLDLICVDNFYLIERIWLSSLFHHPILVYSEEFASTCLISKNKLSMSKPKSLFKRYDFRMDFCVESIRM